MGLVCSQSQILEKEVYLVERLDGEATEQMQHLKAVCFVRPTAQNLELLCDHLKEPRFSEYNVFFSNIVPKKMLATLAEADHLGVVKKVQEFFGDYAPVNTDLVSLNLMNNQALFKKRRGPAYRRLFGRTCDGLAALMLSFKTRALVRYQGSSDLCKDLAYEIVVRSCCSPSLCVLIYFFPLDILTLLLICIYVYVHLYQQRRQKEEAELFDFRRKNESDPVLLILDRRDDPVTPLLKQWIYQAQVHELIGIENNRVDLSAVPGIRQDMHEVVLAQDTDAFFKGSMYLNYGELGASVKNMVEEFQRKTPNASKIKSIEDMQDFFEHYPEFVHMSGTVSKHVTLMMELQRQIDARQLMDVSELEQELACVEDHSNALQQVLGMVRNPQVHDRDKLILVLLYALRYENSNNEIPTLRKILQSQASSDAAKSRVFAIDALLRCAGCNVRSGDLFGNKNFLSKVQKFFSSGLSNVQSVYTQHRPLLAETLESMVAGKLRATDYPFADASDKQAPTRIFAFIVGGVTYAEAAIVAQMNDTNKNVNITLGGSCIHNSSTYLDDVLEAGHDDYAIEVKEDLS